MWIRVRRPKLWIACALTLALSLCVAWPVAKRMISGTIRAEIRSQLEQLSSGAASFSRFAFSPAGLSIHEVRLTDEVTGELFVEIERVDLDLTLERLRNGDRQPTTIALHRPHLRLEFDEQGALRTKLPSATSSSTGPIPSLSVTDGRVTLVRHRRGSQVESETLDGIALAVMPQSDSLAIKATVGRALGSSWQITGDATDHSTVGKLSLSTDHLSLNHQTFARWPLAPFFSMSQVIDWQATGKAEIHVDWNRKTGSRYQIVLDCAEGFARHPATGIELDRVRGLLVIDPHGFVASNVEAGSSLGDIHGEIRGTWNADDTTITCSASADEIACERLAELLGIPIELTGTMAAHSDIRFHSHQGRWSVSTQLSGNGAQVSIAGHPLDRAEVTAQLQNGYHVNGDSMLPEGEIRVELDATQVPWENLLDLTMISPAERPPGITDIEGAFDLQTVIVVPWASPQSPRTYRVDTSVTDGSLAWRGTRASKVRSELQLVDGLVRADLVSMSLSTDGSAAPLDVAARVELSLRPNAQVRVHAQTGDFSADTIVRAVANAGYSLPFIVAPNSRFREVRVEAEVPTRQWFDLAQWRASATIQADYLALAAADDSQGASTMPRHRYEFDHVKARLNLASATLECASLEAHSLGAQLRAQGSVQLADPFPTTMDFTFAGLSVEELLRRATPTEPVTTLGGVAAVSGQVAGTLQPFSLGATGVATFPALRIKDTELQQVTFDWQVDPTNVRVEAKELVLFGRPVELALTSTLTSNTPINIGLRMSQIHLAQFEHLVPAQWHPVSGIADVGLLVEIRSWPDDMTVRVTYECPRLTTADWKLRHCEGVAVWDGDTIEATASGSALGGRIELSGSIPDNWLTRGRNGGRVGDVTGELVIREIPFHRIRGRLPRADTLRPLDGNIDAQINFRVNPDGSPTGDGTVKLTDVRWGRTEWSPLLQGRLHTEPNLVELSDLNGPFAAGRLTTDLRFSTRKNLEGEFRVQLDGVDAQQMLAFSPAAAAQVTGTCSAVVDGRLNDVWYGNARVDMRRSKILAVRFDRLTAPLSWNLNPHSSRLKLAANPLRVQFGRGHITTDLKLELHRGWTVDASSQFTGLNLQKVVERLSGSTYAGTGMVDGNFVIEGRRVHSIDDLTGHFLLKLRQLQPFEMPVMRHVLAYVAQVGSANPVDEGIVRGRLTKGTIHLDEIQLDGDRMQIVGDGKVTTSGNLDLNFDIKTGPWAGAQAELLQLARSPIMLASPTSVQMLLQANEFFANRLIFIRLHGTVANPSVQLQPARQLSQAAMRFLINRAMREALEVL